MKATKTAIAGLLMLEWRRFPDERGFFRELSRTAALAELGIAEPLAQTNHSRSLRHVLRGLHYQLRQPQAKLIQVIRGALFDAVVDIRRGSPTFGRCVSMVLDDETDRALWIPTGCAHGMVTLSDEVDLLYRCSDTYAPGDQWGIRWDDPDLEIPWPIAAPILNERDTQWPRLADADPDTLPIWSGPA